MYINFIADAQKIFKAKLESKGIKLKHNDDAIISWFTYCERLISRRQRKILKAKEFSCPNKYKKKLKRLEQDIKNGADLTPYLSRGIMDCRHDDLMLYDWGIYHLHVSDEFDTKKADGFMKRSNLLLYALFNENTAYFIRTVVHNGDKFMWTKEEWLNIIYENWPYLLDKYKLTNISADKLTDEERKILRSKHINSIVTLKNGITIMPPNLGYACDGTSLIVVMKSDRLKRWLRGIQNYIIQNIKDLLVKICVCGTSYPKVYQIKLLQINGGSLTLEINNHFLINLQTFNTKRINDKGD